MVVETGQILSTVARSNPGRLLRVDLQALYKPTHKNHPCVLWAGSSYSNFIWLREHFFGLADEYTYRYGKVHATCEKLCWPFMQTYFNFTYIGTSENAAKFLQERPPQPFVTAMKQYPQCIVPGDPIQSYRNYYITAKKDIAQWNNGRNPPEWWPKEV
jgi:hypothetical protein